MVDFPINSHRQHITTPAFYDPQAELPLRAEASEHPCERSRRRHRTPATLGRRVMERLGRMVVGLVERTSSNLIHGKCANLMLGRGSIYKGVTFPGQDGLLVVFSIFSSAKLHRFDDNG